MSEEYRCPDCDAPMVRRVRDGRYECTNTYCEFRTGGDNVGIAAVGVQPGGAQTAQQGIDASACATAAGDGACVQ